ncbi:MAG: ATP-binding cassette domain-containing protein, partial [Candidatus Thiodiazotropha sp.]
MSAAALALQGVSFSYTKRQVLDDVSFVLEPGEFCVLLGINGAGKTTLFSLITRLFVSRGGSIEIYGYNLQRQTRKALAQLGVVFQQPTLDLD